MMAGPNRKHEQQRGEDRAAGAEGDVAEDVQRADLVAEVDELVEHAIVLLPDGRAAGPNDFEARSCKARFHRIDQGRHAAPDRTLDHHRVARTRLPPAPPARSRPAFRPHAPLLPAASMS